MPRTTVDIAKPVLREIKELQRKERRSLGQIITQLLAEALVHRKAPSAAPRLQWTSQPMRALVDVSDKEALYAALEKDNA